MNWAKLAVAASPLLPKLEQLDVWYNWEATGFLDFIAPFKGLRSLLIRFYEYAFPTAGVAALLSHCHRQAIRLERLELAGRVIEENFGSEDNTATAATAAAASISHDDALSSTNDIEVPLTLKAFVFDKLNYSPMSNKQLTNLVLAILRHCSSLQEVSLPGLDAAQIEQICEYLRDRKHQKSSFTALDVESFMPGNNYAQADKAFASLILSLNPNTLQKLTFRHGYEGTRVLEAVLSQHPKSIQVLDIGSKTTFTQMTSALACSFLTQCPALTVFRAGQSMSSAILSGNDAIHNGEPWACKDLEVLQLSIGGFCSQSNNVHEGSLEGKSIDLCQTHSECLHLERQVMEQLGRLHHLRVLDISFCLVEEGNPAADGQTVAAPPNLLLTLEAGLDCLASLTYLEDFLCFGFTHHIAISEVNWMRQHWPRIQSLSCGWDDGLYEHEVAKWQDVHMPKVYERMELMRWLE
ncbi:hypothetical protein BGW42_007899 [Actinomortierella wolfii]|nr:hypothetical protein BGW42_007899 [Actinomortierella wolfii]